VVCNIHFWFVVAYYQHHYHHYYYHIVITIIILIFIYLLYLLYIFFFSSSSLLSLIFEIFDLMLSDWVSFLANPNLFGIKGFVVVVVVFLGD
jgi:hypothetical protein